MIAKLLDRSPPWSVLRLAAVPWAQFPQRDERVEFGPRRMLFRADQLTGATMASQMKAYWRRMGSASSNMSKSLIRPVRCSRAYVQDPAPPQRLHPSGQ